MNFDEVESKVLQGGSELVELKATVGQLQARVDRQALAIEALKDMLLAGGYSEVDFLDRLERAATQKAAAKNCRKCGKALNAKHHRCMYCGEPRPPELL